MSRCSICDKRLLDRELLKKDSRGNHLDTCSQCQGEVFSTLNDYTVNDLVADLSHSVTKLPLDEG